MKFINFIKSLPAATKVFLAISLLLIIYGNFARLVGIYFFWESTTFGWILLFIVAIVAMASFIKQKKLVKQRTTGEKIIVGILVFVIAVKVFMMATIYFSGVYASALEHIKNNPAVINETGKVQSIFPKAQGGIQSTNGYGEASIIVIIKGEEKYMELNVHLTREPGTDWQVSALDE